MIPHGRSLVKRLEGKPLALVSIYVDPDGEKLKAALKAEGVSWRALWDGVAGPIHTAWNIESLPTIYVLDPEGVIRYKAEGFRVEELDKAVDMVLKKIGAKP